MKPDAICLGYGETKSQFPIFDIELATAFLLNLTSASTKTRYSPVLFSAKVWHAHNLPSQSSGGLLPERYLTAGNPFMISAELSVEASSRQRISTLFRPV